VTGNPARREREDSIADEEQSSPRRINFYERVDIMNATRLQRLASISPDEPARCVGVVVKCGICLAVLTLLVVIGNQQEGGVGLETRGSAPYAASAARLAGAATHRKEVFDERRARFTGSETDRNVAETALPANGCSGGADGGMDATGNQCNAPGASVVYTIAPALLPHDELTKIEPSSVESNRARPIAVPVSALALPQFRSASLAVPVSRSIASVIAAPTPPVKSDDVPRSTCSGGANGGMDATGNQCSE